MSSDRMPKPTQNPLFRAFSWLVVAASLSVVTAASATAQQTGGGGNTGGGGANPGGGTSSSSQGTRNVADAIGGADEVFSDGIQRVGAPEARGIGTGGAEAAAAGGTNAGGAGGRGGLGGLGGFGGLGGLGGLNQLFGGFGQTQQQNRPVRTRLASGVQVQPLSVATVSATVNMRLDTLASRSRFSGVDVQLTGRKAVLNGRVASDADRKMAALLLRLEPGVSEIENRLTVGND